MDANTPGSHDHHCLTTTGSHDNNTTGSGSHDHHGLTTTGSQDHSSTATGSHNHHTTSYLIDGEEETLLELYKEDSIGDTVFSKAWVLSILVRVVRTVSDEQDQTQLEKNDRTNMNKSQPDDNSISKSDTCPEEVTSFVNADTADGQSGCDVSRVPQGTTAHVEIESNVLVQNMGDDKSVISPRSDVVGNDDSMNSGEDSALELEEQFEGQLCALWDASMNEDVAKFIHKQHGVDLLLGAATRSIMPRLTEICLGILANMLCIEEICMQGVSAAHVGSILQSLQNTDSGVLCQTIRLIHACLSHEIVHPLWLPEIYQSTAVKETLLFILQGSTNDDLLASTSELLDLLVNTSESLLELWVDNHLVEALCEAAEQSRNSNFHVTCILVSTLHTLTTIESGVASVMSCTELVSTLLSNFLLTMDHMDNHSSHVTALTAALSVLLTLVDSESPSNLHGARVKLKDPPVLQALQRLSKESNIAHLSKLSDSVLVHACK